jgi:hypothetical protein
MYHIWYYISSKIIAGKDRTTLHTALGAGIELAAKSLRWVPATGGITAGVICLQLDMVLNSGTIAK